MTIPQHRDDLLSILRDHERRITILERIATLTPPGPTNFIDYITDVIVPDFYFPGNEASGCLVDLMAGQQLCPNAGSHQYGITAGVPTGLIEALGVVNLEKFINPNAPAAGGPLLTATTNFSFFVWGKQAAATASLRFFLENGKMQSGPATGWGVTFDGTTNKFQFRFSDGTTIDQSGTAPEGSWYMVAGTMGATTATLYINGASAGTATPTPGTPTQGTSWGDWQGNIIAASGWNGEMCHLALLNRVLTAQEVADIYSTGLTGTPP